jgi:hypothetical protein
MKPNSVITKQFLANRPLVSLQECSLPRSNTAKQEKELARVRFYRPRYNIAEATGIGRSLEDLLGILMA